MTFSMECSQDTNSRLRNPLSQIPCGMRCPAVNVGVLVKVHCMCNQSANACLDSMIHSACFRIRHSS